jgi:hypothetical protein
MRQPKKEPRKTELFAFIPYLRWQPAAPLEPRRVPRGADVEPDAARRLAVPAAQQAPKKEQERLPEEVQHARLAAAAEALRTAASRHWHARDQQRR